MNWFIKHTRSKYGSGPSPLKFTETTDNPTGDPDKTQWGKEQQTNQTVDQSDWREANGRLVRDTTTTTDFTQSGTSAGQSYKEAGVSAAEGQAYWDANPEEYKKYKESQNVSRQRQDVQTSQEFKDLPKDTSVPAPEKPEFKPYQLSATRESNKREGGRRGLNYDEVTEYTIDSPEEEQDFFKKSAAREAMFDKNYPIMTEHPSAGNPENIQDPKHRAKVQAWLDRKNTERQKDRERNRGRFINKDTGQEYNLSTSSWMDQPDPSTDSFAMNFGTPTKNLNTEGSFSYRQTKRIKK
jgi:hypothetical protein